MASAPIIFFTLYGPAIITVLLLIGALKAHRTPGGSTVVLKPFGTFVDLRIPVTGAGVARVVFVCGALTAFCSYLFIDYTSLFPRELQMEVFFDRPGIARSLEAFSVDELKAFHVPSDCESLREEYFRQLDAEVQKVLNTKVFFSVRQGNVHGSGQTSFIVEKTTGIQNYHIARSRGELTHFMEVARLPQREFMTIFEKMNSRDDYVTPTVKDLFVTRSVVLRPIFKQLLAQDRGSKTVVFRFSVVGATKIFFFPWPRYSNTIYLADFGDKGLVPIGYAIYR
jgi:hypothetical protein